MNKGIHIYLDGADLKLITKWAKHPAISGFTTNPSLLKAAGVTNYAEFGRLATAAALGKPISFEVVADSIGDMNSQARIINKWGPNVFVKIPITNAIGVSTLPLVTRLAEDGIKVNVTAVFTTMQIYESMRALIHADDAIVSIFAGRIADTGCEPEEFVADAVRVFRTNPRIRVLWASAREVYNVRQAVRVDADIITMTPALFDKVAQCWGKDLTEY